MAGHAFLSGERAQRALVLLRQVTDILTTHRVRWWLDSGTLLGAVREQRLLPWDTDMDIAVRGEDLQLLANCIPALRRAGLRVRMRRHKTHAPAAVTGQPRLLKVANRRWGFWRGDLLLDVFVVYQKGDRCYWTIGEKRSLKHLSVPAHFYDRLETLEFDAHMYSVPSDATDYLALRYGNWRVPVYKWNCFEDDRATCTVIEKSPVPTRLRAARDS